MQTILVPTDFSPSGLNAAEYAAQLARQFSAKLVLFHAYMMPTPVSEVPYAMANVEEMQKENEEALRKEADYIRQQYKLETEQIVRIGVASDEIRELCREKNVDLVIMGIKGAGGLDKIIGSTSINTIRKIKIPVLVVPHDAEFRVIKDIVYASDFSYKSTPTLFNPLIKLAEKFDAKIHILNIEKQKEKVTVEEVVGSRGAEMIFQDMDHEFVTVQSDSITHGINDYLQTRPGQMLVMVAHKHNFFERIFSRSHTTAMAYETHIPLLILQDKE
jgi:nucleotide-binding universal stress UspA family protein